jgi:diguanylate cyclase (GGDEF)-like protein
MPALTDQTPKATKAAVPLEIYASLVDALFDDRRSLFIGSATASLAAILTAWKSGHWVLFAFGVAIAVIAYVRFLDMRAYSRARDNLKTAKEFRSWEVRYAYIGAVFLALLGLWTLATFVVTNDPFTHLFSFTVTVCYLIGTFGRNFASRTLVIAQTIAAVVPMSAALFYSGGVYYTIFGLILPTFFAGMISISNRLRKTLLDAVIATQEITLLAKRFDTALTNMPHGLCMFDAEKRLVVSNGRLADLLNIPREALTAGKAARDIILESIGGGGAPNLDIDHFVIEFDQFLSGGNGSLFVEIRDGQTLAFTVQPMDNGGSVVVVEDITERRNAEARINHLARFDALTGLPNRAFFHDELDRIISSMRRTGPSAILFVDLDQFKQVNDTLGHPRGDELLCAVADRLRDMMRKTDVVARFGGDEFVVLQSPLRSSGDAAGLAQRIVEALSRPYDIDGHEVVIGASIGIAMAPRDGIDADLLLKNADMALYHAKAGGRAAWRFFEPDMDVKAQARRALELDLRNAVAQGNFELYYQPLFNLKTMRISTCEALIRWRHPERGMISPAEFIPVAEDIGIIVEIGEWVLRAACAECMNWPEDIRVAVNLSPVQFRRDDMTSVIARALAESKLPAHRLEVEITESLLLQNVELARRMLQELRDMGVRISLDDFGTGYSGLSYLHTFPLQKVKIDRSFVQSLTAGDRSLTLLKGVANLSAALGMSVAVEGIETEEQLATIAAENCIDEAQGYLFSIPIPGRQIRELLYSSAPQWVGSTDAIESAIKGRRAAS